jgi:hypothetical protein
MARVHPDDRGADQRALHRSLACAEPFRSDHRVQYPCGGFRMLRSVGRVITDVNGDPQRIRGITQELTDHARTSLSGIPRTTRRSTTTPR